MVRVGESNALAVENELPEKIDNVQMYVGDRWFSPFNGLIKNLKVETTSD